MKKSHFALNPVRNKISNGVNQDNQLLVKPKGAKSPLVVNGQFSLDKDNNLIYFVHKGQSPSLNFARDRSGTVPYAAQFSSGIAPVGGWRREYDLPKKIKFKGVWRLSPDYNLELYLDETRQQIRGKCLTLRGKILYAEAEALAFQIKSRDERGVNPVRKKLSNKMGLSNGVNRVSLLKLSGIWQADKFNRIIFQIKKKAKPDTLVFKGAWRVNKNQQITYEYEKTKLKTKRKIKNALVFTGFWRISSVNRLSYILSGSSQSRFDFRVQLETPNLYPKKGAIKYRVGVGIKESLRPTQIRIITLYGAWKFSRRLGLYFEMNYGQGKIRRLAFNTEVNLTQRDKVIFKLKDTMGRGLGISVIFLRRFLSKRDAEWFLRLKKDRREKKIESGVRIGF